MFSDHAEGWRDAELAVRLPLFQFGRLFHLLYRGFGLSQQGNIGHRLHDVIPARTGRDTQNFSNKTNSAKVANPRSGRFGLKGADRSVQARGDVHTQAGHEISGA